MQIDKSTRLIAGYAMKSSLSSLFNSCSPEVQYYIRSTILQTLIHPNFEIRNAASVITSHLVSVGSLEKWPELIPSLTQLLQSDNKDYIITGLSCLSKVMEDNIFELDSAAVNYPLNKLIPMLLHFFYYPDETVVYHAVNCMRFSIEAMPNALLVNMNEYLRSLSWLLNHSNDEILALICNSLVSLLEVRVDALIPSLNEIIGFMLMMSQSQNTFVATQATGLFLLICRMPEFWSSFAMLNADEEVMNYLVPTLPSLVPVLIHVLFLSRVSLEYAVFRCRADSDACRQSLDLRRKRLPPVQLSTGERREVPFPHSSHPRNEMSMETADGEWSLRQASAWSLDTLSNTYPTELIDVAIPIISVRAPP